ncbi:heterokaryon incompatibility protein-domain-containing protein [Xylaria arbuscula]|nr:heterokaryon incompatibility protein-domain-containing protein [Xylaria arbuscula]
MAEFEFQYEKIDNIPGGDHIRVLSLAASENYNDPIHVNLWVVKLTDAPSYEALSYCWGDASDKRPISCDGKPFLVTKNLESALRRLRQPHADNILWIDAICINQNDLAERSYQVTLMHHIYRGADRVLVWLGTYSDTQGDAIHCVFPMCRKMMEFYSDLILEDPEYLFSTEFNRRPIADRRVILKQKLKETRRRKAMSEGTLSEATDTGKEKNEDEGDEEVLYPTRREVTAALEITNRPWFTRCWVLQEVALASEVVILCGSSSIGWDKFFSGFYLIVTLNDGAMMVRGSTEFSKSNLTLLSTSRNQLKPDEDTSQGQPVELLWLLWQVRHLEVTDPRDKVYSHLGMIDPELARSTALRPDYTLPVEECYRRAAIAVLSHSKNLDLLITDHNIESSLNLPSWVPDWGCQKSQAPLLFCREDDREDLTRPGYNQFRASASKVWNVAGRVDGKVLKLSGYVIDVITELEDVLTVPQLEQADHVGEIRSVDAFASYWDKQVVSIGSYLHELVKWEKLAFSRKNSRYPSGEDAETVLAMTLSAGGVDGHEVALASFREWRKVLRGPKAVNPLGRFGSDSRIYRSVVTLTAWTDAIRHRESKVYADAIEISLNRRLARTDKGYLALVPRQSAVGDRISLFEGGRMPFVIRRLPHSNGYKLVGPSYVHGIMHGEAWNSTLVREIAIH